MKRFLLSVVIVAPLCASSFADPLQESYRMNDHGRLREFEIARDEIQKDQRAIAIQSRGSADDVRIVALRAGGDLVLFEKGRPRSESTRRLLTRRIAVQIAPGQDPAAIARAVGAENANPAPFAPNWYIFQSSGEPGSALQVTQKLKRQAGVVSAEPMLARQQTKRLIPNDPLFNDQWHLLNTGQFNTPAGIDLNVTGVWDTFTGTGTNIAIVDDGLEHTHPDLAPNYQAALSYDFNFNSPDPQPAAFDGDIHGTACAGLAAAAGNNSIGVTGVAFKAGLAGIRLIALPDTDEQEAEAFALNDDVIDVKSNSWGPADDGKTLAGPGPLAAAALENAVQTGRGGLGTIFTWAGGNGALNGDASTFDGYASSREVIAVGALTSAGVRAPYSELGTNLICVAPSSGGKKDLSITTVDRAGQDGYNFDGFGDLSDPDYTDTFGGTSAASPQAAGVVALMLQAQSNLGWRDVQEILLKTSRQIDLGNDNGVSEGWITNSAGFHFNDQYGAGLIDASAAVDQALTWTNLGPEISISQEVDNLARVIPDNKPAGVSFSFNFNDPNFRIEHAIATVNIQHASRGQLQINLISPAGVTSHLAPLRHKDKTANYDLWPFLSTHHWGEFANGTWTVNVADRVAGSVGTLNSIKLEFFGSSPAVHTDPNGYTLSVDPNHNGGIDPGETVTVSFSVKNDGVHTATNLAGTLQASADVTNPTATPVSFGTLTPGQSGQASFQFTAGAGDTVGQTIFATLNLSYMDGANAQTSAVTFPIVLGAVETASFSNINSTSADPIAIPSFASTNGAGNASPYPSTINVTGLPNNATVTNVVLHLNYFEHTKTNTVTMLLVSPTSKAMIPMSDVGVSGAEEINLTLSDLAETALPDSLPLQSGTYLPTNKDATLHTFPAPPHASAPPKPSGAGFSVFNGTNPSGTWQLFIRDDKAGGFGGMGNWSLDITYAH